MASKPPDWSTRNWLGPGPRRDRRKLTFAGKSANAMVRFLQHQGTHAVGQLPTGAAGNFQAPYLHRWSVTGYGRQAMGTSLHLRAPLPQRLRHFSSALNFFAKDKEVKAKESSPAHAERRPQRDRLLGDELRHSVASRTDQKR